MKKNTRLMHLIIAFAAIFSPQLLRAEEIIYDAPEDTATNQAAPIPVMKAIATTKKTPTPTIKNDTKKPASSGPAKTEKPKMTAEQTKQKFKELKKEIDGGTSNLDTYFEYAQIATAIGEAKEAVGAYKYMLDTDPSLHRVKLELALLYARMGKLKSSKKLFEDVLATNPPEAVKNNINKVMAVVDKGLKPDVFSGSLSTGYNIDTNANSAASSGQNTLSNINVTLTPGSTATRDGHAYALTTLSHVHKFDIDSEKYKLNMETTGVLYKTRQDTERTLDLSLASIKTGPTIELTELKTKLGISGNMSIIELNGWRYLKSRSWESTFNYTMKDNLLINGSYGYEYRKFINSPTSSSYTDRSGNANQQTLGVTYALTPLDVFNSTVTWRYENAFSQVYGNTQTGVTGTYIRQLPWNLSFNTLLGFKETNYHKPDPLVSATTLRHDRERSMTYTLSKKLPHNVTIGTAYQYRNVTSNVQNNNYHNNRYSATLGWTW